MIHNFTSRSSKEVGKKKKKQNFFFLKTKKQTLISELNGFNHKNSGVQTE